MPKQYIVKLKYPDEDDVLNDFEHLIILNKKPELLTLCEIYGDVKEKLENVEENYFNLFIEEFEDRLHCQGFEIYPCSIETFRILRTT